MNSDDHPLKPTQHAERKLLTAILNGDYPPGSVFPSERKLAELIGVTRPTLRETLQRMSREGWITIRHGKPTIVNDYINKGGMGLMATLSDYSEFLPDGFVRFFLEVRSVMMPEISKKACENDPEKLIAYLEKAEDLDDDVKKFTQFDWELQLLMASCTKNPIYRMILKDFTTMYSIMGELYFFEAESRKSSMAYFRNLLDYLKAKNSEAVQKEVRRIMEKSIELWQQLETLK